MTGMVRSTLWLGFFALILAAWWMMYSMAMQMDVDLVEEDIEVIADYMLTLRSDDYVRRPG